MASIAFATAADASIGSKDEESCYMYNRMRTEAKDLESEGQR